MREGWEIRKLGEVCDLYQPKTISSDMLVSNGKYLVYGANGIIGRYNEYNHEKPEVLMTCRGATCGTINVSQPYSWINGNAMVIHPKENNIIQPFLKYLLQGIDLSIVITGAAQPQITRQSLKPVKVVLPPVQEQEKIVAELDCLSGIIDKKKQQLVELDNLAGSIFYDMFGSVVEKRGIPVSRMDDVFSLITDGTHQTPTYTEDKENGYKFLSAKDVVGGHIDWDGIKYIPATLHQELYKRLAPRRGDLLLCKNGTTGIAAVVETDEVFDIYVSLALLRPKEGYQPKYLLYAINNQETKRQFNASLKGVGVPNLHLGEIRKTLILTPPLDRQNAFAQKIEAIEKQKELIKKSIQETETLFNSRMDYWFN